MHLCVKEEKKKDGKKYNDHHNKKSNYRVDRFRGNCTRRAATVVTTTAEQVLQWTFSTGGTTLYYIVRSDAFKRGEYSIQSSSCRQRGCLRRSQTFAPSPRREVFVRHTRTHAHTRSIHPPRQLSALVEQEYSGYRRPRRRSTHRAPRLEFDFYFILKCFNII